MIHGEGAPSDTEGHARATRFNVLPATHMINRESLKEA
jgi:hypothetical protein